MRKTLLALALAVSATVGLAACSTPEQLELAPDTVIIDVRTPAEYGEGHLEGAVNIDVSAPDFADRIADLPADGEYLVYCRSGNRSAAAAGIMAEQGFDEVIDAGAVGDASSATGLAIVTD